jgi:hypothetical protein
VDRAPFESNLKCEKSNLNLLNSLYAYDPPEVNVRDPPEMYIFMDVYDPPQVCVHDLPEVYV